MVACWLLSLLLSLHHAYRHAASAAYVPIVEYSGQNFFNGWDYYGFIDNTTWGNVSYVDQPTALSQHLTYVNDAGNAIIRVDNTTVIPDAPIVNRNTVRLTTQQAFPIGTLVVADVLHIPFGCSVWPSLWTLGENVIWPHGGEIDMIEGINQRQFNQMSVHTDPGCVQAPSVKQGGTTQNTDCSQARGCSVTENKPNSFGSDFAAAGGGVFGMQFDVAGVFIWFWSRPDVPASITQATPQSSIDLSDWGLPSAAFPSSTTSCDMAKLFQPQQLVITITLCGHWAGIPDQYAATCPGTCISNVIGSGNPVYNDAFFEIPYIKVFSASNNTNTASSSSPSSVGSGSPAASQTGGAKNVSDTTNPTTGKNSSMPAASLGALASFKTLAYLVSVIVASTWIVYCL